MRFSRFRSTSLAGGVWGGPIPSRGYSHGHDEVGPVTLSLVRPRFGEDHPHLDHGVKVDGYKFGELPAGLKVVCDAIDE